MGVFKAGCPRAPCFIGKEIGIGQEVRVPKPPSDTEGRAGSGCWGAPMHRTAWLSMACRRPLEAGRGMPAAGVPG